VSSSPTGVAVGHLATLTAAADVSSPGQSRAVPQGLLEALWAVPDPRKARGVRYRFGSVLAVAVCAVLSGARSYAAIAEWAHDTGPDQRRALGLDTRAPDPVTIWRVLTSVDPLALDRVIGDWVARHLARRRRLRKHRRPVLAVDGKTLRGARIRGGQDRAPHLMACLDHASGTVLAQVAVGDKTNEIPMFATVLDQIGDLTDVLITADAMHAQRDHATYLAGRGAHYLLTVKANQPTLRGQLKALPWTDVPVGHTASGRAHGRMDKRSIKVVTVTAGLAFPHAAQAIQITRRTRRLNGTKWRTETVYAITSLPAERAQPAQLARWIRDHWKIENQLHWVRDVTYGEDVSQARSGNGPHIMASLRNLAISILRFTGHTNIAAALRHTARAPNRALQLIDRTADPTLQ
jgi:predicted transposase YbfD/YdcC